MGKPFIAFDLAKLKISVEQTNVGFDVAKVKYLKAMETALLAYAEDILGEAVQKVPPGKGELRGAGTTVGPVVEGDSVTVLVAFNKVYARIRDLGGVIRPVRARALFIPLVPGVRPGQPGLIQGIDFVLAKKVTQKGNKYLTGTIEGRLPTALQSIGTYVAQLVAA